MSGIFSLPEPDSTHGLVPDEATLYDLQPPDGLHPLTDIAQCRAEIARLDRRIDELAAAVSRLVDVVQVIRLQLEDDAL